MNLTDTIAAISTPIGEGGIGIIRISGAKAIEAASAILRTSKKKSFHNFIDHHVYYGMVVNPETGQTVDEVLFFYAKKPRSFTAEDVVEIQAHGGTLILSSILNLVLNEGVRLAEPGEFTMRAFLNGRIDLVQAESVIDLIRAKTEKAHQLALSQLTGKITNAIHQIESDLYSILIRLEALLDFPEDGIPDLEKEDILSIIQQIIDQLEVMVKSVDEGRKIREGITIAIVGKPNVGKSSLLNAFTQEEKAIVTDLPGTTRDVIDVQFQLRGVPIILMDTAGLHETENKIEKIGIERAEFHLKNAQLALVVLDGSQPLTAEDHFVLQRVKNKKSMIIINKIDLPQQFAETDLSLPEGTQIVRVSSLTREGLDQLEEALVTEIGIGNLNVDDRPMLSRVRHKKALLTAVDSLRNFRDALSRGESEDLLAIELRASLFAIGEITGKNVNDEVLHGIFANFCIGK